MTWLRQLSVFLAGCPTDLSEHLALQEGGTTLITDSLLAGRVGTYAVGSFKASA
jgi:hypothetical protein